MSVNLRELKQVGAKYREKRRGRRMNSRVHVRLEWEAAGQREFIETHTRIVNPYGCMVVMPGSFEIQQRLALTNLCTHAMLRSSSGKGISSPKAGNTASSWLRRIWTFGGWSFDTFSKTERTASHAERAGQAQRHHGS